MNKAIDETRPIGQITAPRKLRTRHRVIAWAGSACMAAAAASPLLLAGCNTSEGVGEDIEAVGDEIEDAAD